MFKENKFKSFIQFQDKLWLTRIRRQIQKLNRIVKDLEQVITDVVSKAKEQKDSVNVRGPIRMPTKHLKMTIRKSPCGEGSKTWDRYEMRIHKRVIILECTAPKLKEITNLKLKHTVNIEINFDQED
ncbi:hypothetical protein pb186bvf_006550 [Paramecium bursaria]